jgi:hypothetical protein
MGFLERNGGQNTPDYSMILLKGLFSLYYVFSILNSQYSRHLLTAKHLNRVNDSTMIVKKLQEVPNKKSFVCGCGKEYRYDSGFYRY